MAKPLKVDHAVCPKCHFRKPLDENGCYKRHLNYGHKFSWETSANVVCEGSGLKASRRALCMERIHIREKEAIEHRHAERLRLQIELRTEADKFQDGRSINAEAFVGLLKAYGIWDSIPSRRKNTIKDRLKCLNYAGSFINIIMHNSKASQGIMPHAQELLVRLSQRLF